MLPLDGVTSKQCPTSSGSDHRQWITIKDGKTWVGSRIQNASNGFCFGDVNIPATRQSGEKLSKLSNFSLESQLVCCEGILVLDCLMEKQDSSQYVSESFEFLSVEDSI